MAQNLLKQEEAQRLEKERLKKLTLEINERQEEEDLNEAIAMVTILNSCLFALAQSVSHFFSFRCNDRAWCVSIEREDLEWFHRKEFRPMSTLFLATKEITEFISSCQGRTSKFQVIAD